MRVAIVADVFPPLRSSGAVQLRDLSREFVRQGHQTTVLVASPDLKSAFRIDEQDGVTIARLRSPKTKDVGYVRRMAGEFLMPFAMKRNYRKSPIAGRPYDAVIWYSPTIFLGPIVRWLKRRNNCASYLIIRDIFPQWAADMGLISRGPAFQLLDQVARYQYRSADVIGVQTPGNLSFFDDFRAAHSECQLEVLQNWLGDAPDRGCSIDLEATKLAGRRIFVYAGNMGVAQQMDKLLDCAVAMRDRDDIGFLFVGRGSEADRLSQLAAERSPDTILFHDEISPDEIPGLYSQCNVGLICLDSRHRTHNIPGKFLTYMQAGLPVLASINDGNDLQKMVETRNVGRVSVAADGADLPGLASALIERELADPAIADRCRALSNELFSARAAVGQILDAVTQR
ncbi:colanic acid biosynthesis glycosyl transferase [Sphingopyxis sp. Root214]|jgi:glycosyltransferase involved in cell wall biosynthesis|uniref:glycosyltransferase family 4 protein n=1 Tax=unclassified Sphingopyxis TaxID=2614943 RepID=UPI0006F85E10|nr:MULTISPECIES: glycosyltransferase family 4 protein [unclassified Sphingopyxis]KQZ76400.1 colanic acid biosynthesis glycosyl transferase [Sphingopyxis sp. Root154]KRC09712.1 colanic acid biosynthesis glycosyl transferase [Sphingopyxis sp. Root214]